MYFDTRVDGIPCRCVLLNYSPARSMEVTGPGMGDAHPPEPSEYDFQLLDSRGYRAHWLEEKLRDSAIADKLHEEIGHYINVIKNQKNFL